MKSGNTGSFKNMGSSPAKQRSTKGGEGKDQNKIFNDQGNHIGDYVNGKKVMKSTTSAHGQLDDAQHEFEMDMARPNKAKDKALNKMLNKKSPAKQTKFPNSPKAKKRKMVSVLEGAYKEGLKEAFIKSAKDIGRATMNKKSPAKQAKKSGLGPSTAFGGVKNPELIKSKKTKSKKVMKDGLKNRTHGAGDTGNWQPHQFKK